MRRSYTWSLAKLHTKSHESGGTDNERRTSLKRYDNAIIQTGRQVAINVTGLRAVIFFIRGSTRVWRMTEEKKKKRKKEGGIEKYVWTEGGSISIWRVTATDCRNKPRIWPPKINSLFPSRRTKRGPCSDEPLPPPPPLPFLRSSSRCLGGCSLQRRGYASNSSNETRHVRPSAPWRVGRIVYTGYRDIYLLSHWYANVSSGQGEMGECRGRRKREEAFCRVILVGVTFHCRGGFV